MPLFVQDISPICRMQVTKISSNQIADIVQSPPTNQYRSKTSNLFLRQYIKRDDGHTKIEVHLPCMKSLPSYKNSNMTLSKEQYKVTIVLLLRKKEESVKPFVLFL